MRINYLVFSACLAQEINFLVAKTLFSVIETTAAIFLGNIFGTFVVESGTRAGRLHPAKSPVSARRRMKIRF